MSLSDQPAPSAVSSTHRPVGLRLLTSLLALTAGVIALVIALLLVRSTLA